MSNESKEIITSLQNGVLPPLISSQPDNCTKSKGIEVSQRGLENTVFGLQTLSESKE